nr:unnamed protein product [Digitaria exilis]
MPLVDSLTACTKEVSFKALTLERGDAYKLFHELPIQENAGAHLEYGMFRSSMASEGANIQGVNEIPLADVVWDEAPLHNLDLQYDMLQQIAQVEEGLSGEESKPVDVVANDQFCTQIHALGSKHFDSEQAKLIIQSDNGDIMWDEDVPHNLGLHNTILEQLNDVMLGQGGNDLVTGVGGLPSAPQFDVVTSKDTFDEISKDHEMNRGSENLVSGEMQRGSDLQFVFVELHPGDHDRFSIGIDGMKTECLGLGNTQSWGFGGLCLRKNFSPLWSKEMPAQRHGNFTAGQIQQEHELLKMIERQCDYLCSTDAELYMCGTAAGVPKQVLVLNMHLLVSENNTTKSVAELIATNLLVSVDDLYLHLELGMAGQVADVVHSKGGDGTKMLNELVAHSSSLQGSSWMRLQTYEELEENDQEIIKVSTYCLVDKMPRENERSDDSYREQGEVFLLLQKSSVSCAAPELVWDEDMHCFLNAHCGLLEQLAMSSEYMNDERTNQVAKLGVSDVHIEKVSEGTLNENLDKDILVGLEQLYGSSANGTQQKSRNISPSPINEWSDSFGDFETNLTDDGHMEYELVQPNINFQGI